jgi:excisionase family DNA binding protein
MNVKELSEYLRIHINTARKKVSSGEIIGTRTVKGFEIPIQSVINYLKQYEQSTK